MKLLTHLEIFEHQHRLSWNSVSIGVVKSKKVQCGSKTRKNLIESCKNLTNRIKTFIQIIKPYNNKWKSDYVSNLFEPSKEIGIRTPIKQPFNMKIVISNNI